MQLSSRRKAEVSAYPDLHEAVVAGSPIVILVRQGLFLAPLAAAEKMLGPAATC